MGSIKRWLVLVDSPFIGPDLIEAIRKAAISLSINGAGYCASPSRSCDQLLTMKAARCLVDAHIIRVSLIVDPGVLCHILSSSIRQGGENA